jgi:hypothetical protein
MRQMYGSRQYRHMTGIFREHADVLDPMNS